MTAQITLSNPGPDDLTAFVDPRLLARTLYGLVPYTPATDVPLPLTGTDPSFTVPNETSALYASTQGSAPLTFDWGFLDPDLGAVSSGDTASGWFAAPEVTPGGWVVTPSLIGPFQGPASGTVSITMLAQAQAFDPAVTSSTGDPELADVIANPPAAQPTTIPPGTSATIHVTFTPAGAPGQTVRGELFLDNLQSAFGSADELAAIPYAYKTS